jgi:sigma-B regulation protein RsbU (phosphoserine phosphatase)
MHHVALAAPVLVAVWLFVGDREPVAGSFAGALLSLATLASVLLTISYYPYRLFRRFANLLLWRVRRRLVITYLFVGLTPIVLLALLGVISAFGISAEAMARIVSAEIDLLKEQSASTARALAGELRQAPSGAAEVQAGSWLRERERLLQAPFPGASLTLVHGAGALPGWLGGQQRWRGLALVPPAGGSGAGSPDMRLRAFERLRGGKEPRALLLDLPLGGGMLERLRAATGLGLDPVPSSIRLGAEAGELAIEPAPAPEQGGELRLDRVQYVVVLDTIQWATGEAEQKIAFLFDWSWAEAIRQIMGSSLPGRFWQRALLAVGAAFLALELVALAAAVLMTRAVTRTVHELHRSTECVRGGDFSYRARIGSRDQLGDLAEAFNDMSASIETLLVERVRRERLERELEIAAEVQARLFPRRAPALPSLEIAGECRAARGVAGDYYDYLEIAPHLLGLALGDISGKGVSASLLMSNLQASLRALSGLLGEGGEGSVARVMAAVNSQLCRSVDDNRFATLFLVLYDERSRALRYSSAGHGAGLLLDGSGGVERLERGGMMVGAFEGGAWEEGCAPFPPGSLLVLSSDGIHEAASPAGDHFGEERLVECVLAHRHRPAGQVRDAIFNAVDEWRGLQDRNDDQTVVVVKALQIP